MDDTRTVIIKSTHLRIRVTEFERVKADVTLRAELAANLANLLPPDLEPKLEAREIDVQAIAAAAVENDFEPGELFRLDEGPKSVCVWLE